MSQTNPTRQFATLTQAARHFTGGLVSRIGQQLWALGVHPDVITFAGLVVVAIAGYVIAQGEFFWGAVIIFAGMPLDAVDGAIARAMKRTGKFGALWDSSLDRYADAFIFLGLVIHFSRQDNELMLLLAIFAMIGSGQVSYVRARAGGLRVACEVGLFTRMERTIVLLIMLATGWVKPGLWLLAIGTNFTVAQRIWHVYNELKNQGR